MKKVKRVFLVLLTFLALTGLTACGKKGDSAADGKLKVVATIFPGYDWVREILGDKADNAELTFLLDNGVDMHSFQPTTDDIVTISNCDVFIYVGGESDKWVDDVIKTADNKNMKTVNLLETVGDAAKEEESKEGMQEEEHDHGDEDGEEHEHEMDEHIWLSLRNAKLCCEAIEKALADADKDNASVYESNLDAYKKKLDELDGAYIEAISASAVKTLLFGDRFPFRYLTEDYGLDYFAAFSGCSAETEASFETVKFLSDKAAELKLKHIMTIEGSDKKLAQTIIDSSGLKECDILTLNSIQSVDGDDLKSGVTYLELMEGNLEILKQALN